MRIILSRKGFDAQYGGQPSPILPDGTLLSLPIPEPRDTLTYDELQHGGQSYGAIIQGLRPSTPLRGKSCCHLDPDLDDQALPRTPGWRPLLGQTGAAQGHLAKCGVGKGDLFLFFGTFRQTERGEQGLAYRKDAPEVHMIFGYLQVGEVIDPLEDDGPEISYHPHAQERFRAAKHNRIYRASEWLDFLPELPGGGVLKAHPGLQLTKPGFSKSRWQLPDCFRNVSISYHTPKSFRPTYFQSAAKGQEFVVTANEKVKDWAKGLIKEGNRF
ncbi:hypothetical protein [Echinicola vietnamensis]|uniref:Nucleotide modification associated domain-containing protein n=1 Tax=Echinicola vietnamensis (strain DSM 17526 / LMG 23754 / KMM 6221) TaxID=926556 RepID=L0FV41_ECHVK|nr:hypothetical protein [Echinicola vietnamensis]AGA76621.1 hypothetical protein Echvi_0330 [Echinicola vietnamensis DSM 17526]